MKIFILFPVHLFKNVELIKEYDKVLLVEEPLYFTKYNFHKLKLCFHRATMKKYFDYLIKKNINVTYVNFDSEYLSKLKVHNVNFYDPIDHDLISKIKTFAKKNKLSVTIHNNPSFITSREDFDQYHNNVFKTKFALTSSFYRWQRNRLDILCPIGKKYKLSYDDENREAFDKNQVDVFRPNGLNNKYVLEAKKYVNKHFKNNYGSTDNMIYPIDHNGANAWLKNFIKHRIEHFGKFEDAFNNNVKFGYHSVLSPLLNVGLITDSDVIAEVSFVKKHISISSYEGYIRQIIGWKQGVRYLYEYHYEKFYEKNFMKHKNVVPNAVWTATTLLPPIDDSIKKATKYGYLHHIERLMVMGNFFMLLMIKPKDVFEWFISIVSMDAYQWVMYPNVYGMVTYADGGFMMSRPYISSSAYLKTMGNYGKDKSVIKLGNETYKWYEVWDALYYNFINKHYALLKSNYFMARNAYHWTKKSDKAKAKLLNIAKMYIRHLYKN
jgi:deoxyribodipyrimidine photolyase-related protein